MFNGDVSGVISNSPRGKNGFGWDPIFIPDGHTNTWGEMDMDQQDKTSMRKIALKKLAVYLQNYNHMK